MPTLSDVELSLDEDKPVLAQRMLEQRERAGQGSPLELVKRVAARRNVPPSVVEKALQRQRQRLAQQRDTQTQAALRSLSNRASELESRTARLDALPDEIQQVIFGQLGNALDPRTAVAYSSASKGLLEPMQRVGEGDSKSPLQQLKEENAAAAALCLKLGVRSCNALREGLSTGLSTTDLATLGKLIPVLPVLSRCCASLNFQPLQPAPTACSWWRGWAWARCRP